MGCERAVSALQIPDQMADAVRFMESLLIRAAVSTALTLLLQSLNAKGGVMNDRTGCCGKGIAGHRADRLTFASDRYDLERYQRLRAIAVAMMASGSGTAAERISALFEQTWAIRRPSGCARSGISPAADPAVREISDAFGLAGWWGDVNESPKECVEREIQEESGFQAGP